MTLFVFENMSAKEAEDFDGAVDQIIFSDRTTTALNLGVALDAFNTVTLTGADGTAIRFHAADIAAASQGGRLVFTDGSNVGAVIGTAGHDTLEFANAVSASAKGIFYGFAGNDEIATNDGPSYVFGGAGNDVIDGGSGNDHLYGFGVSGDTTIDGDDLINGGAGKDYIQGNAGNDTLHGDDGDDRINGGQGDDLIFGDDGHDSINGNKGSDTISGGDGNDIVRGGQDDDLLNGDAGNDLLSGDRGKDTLVGGAGIDVLAGGEGADLFRFADGDAGFATSGSLAYFADEIVDFTVGEDKIDLGGTIGVGSANLLYAQEGVSFTGVAAALTYAQQLVTQAASATFASVAAIQVGSDTYLFYDDNGVDNVINAMIRLDGVSAADFTTAAIV